jgi:cytochrome c2
MSRVKAVTVMFAVLPLSCLLMAGLKQQGLSGNAAKGRDVFIGKGCVKCHSVWGVGGKMGPDLTRLGKGASFFQIAASLWSHSPRMMELMEQRGVPLPRLNSEEMGDLIFYFYYLNYFNEPGDHIAGQQHFLKKGCASCHSVGNMGGRTGPRLDNYDRYGSPLFVSQAMWNHGPEMIAAIERLGAPAPRFEGREMADLLAFIRHRASRPASSQQLMVPGDPIAGERQFSNKGCARCHSPGAGRRGLGPDLLAYKNHRSVSQIAGAMWNHGPQMWSMMQASGMARPEFRGNEMADLIAYLYFTRYLDGPGDPGKGKQLFARKGCGDCHSVGKEEGLDLRTSEALGSPIDLITSMWNHAEAMEKLVEEKGLPWPKFQEDDLKHLIAYLRSLEKSRAK